MAKKRMFNVDIVGSDAFLDLPHTAQALYFQLGMRADDDGFVGNPKTIQRIAGTKASDLELLVKKRFLLQFPSGVVVIKHWKINNQIQKDRYTPTVYTEEYQSLYIKDNKAYTETDKECIQSVSEMDTQISIDKSRLDKNSRGGEKHAHGFFANVLLTDDEMQKLAAEISNYEEYIEKLSHYIESNGKKYKSHYATILMWHRKDREKQPAATAEALPQAPRRKSL
jgi:Asp-tRNA(Asn)/Glu-tRNA(Gln) amidotransferase C subunit